MLIALAAGDAPKLASDLPEPGFTPYAPIPRKSLPNLATVLFHLYRNPIALLTEEHYRQPVLRNRMFGMSAVFLNDPAHVRHVFVQNRANYRIDPIRRLLLSRNFGAGIAAADGGKWKAAREYSARFFSPAKIAKYARIFRQVAETHCDSMIGAKQVSLSEFVSRITFENTLRTLFAGDTNGSDGVVAATSEIMATGMSLDVMDLLRMPLSIPRFMKGSIGRHHRLFRGFVKALSDRGADAGQNGSENAAPTHLQSPETGMASLAAGFKTAGLSDDRDMRFKLDNIGTFLCASFETTTLALCWTLYFLARSRAHLHGVLAEIRSLRHGQVAPHEWLSRLPLTLAAIRETLRLYPPLPAITRQAKGRDKLGAEQIEPGDYLVANIWTMHRSPDHWRDAAKYLPERFLPGGEIHSNGERYFPFGIGPRACIGRQFAEVEAVVVLATILRRLEIRPIGDTVARAVWRGTLRPERPIEVQIRRLAQNCA